MAVELCMHHHDAKQLTCLEGQHHKGALEGIPLRRTLRNTTRLSAQVNKGYRQPKQLVHGTTPCCCSFTMILQPRCLLPDRRCSMQYQLQTACCSPSAWPINVKRSSRVFQNYKGYSTQTQHQRPSVKVAYGFASPNASSVDSIAAADTVQVQKPSLLLSATASRRRPP